MKKCKCSCCKLKNLKKWIFESIPMIVFGEIEVKKEQFYEAKNPINFCDVDVNITRNS